jgi:hypothetical protein
MAMTIHCLVFSRVSGLSCREELDLIGVLFHVAIKKC